MDLGEDSMASDGGDVGVPPFGSVPADYVQFFYARSHLGYHRTSTQISQKMKSFKN